MTLSKLTTGRGTESSCSSTKFDLPEPEDHYSYTFGDSLRTIDDESLVELAGEVFGKEPSEVVEASRLDGDIGGNWKPGYLRAFLSHSAVHKAQVAGISHELAVVGIDGFVAHDSLEVSVPWQAQIESALRSMEVLVVLVHPELNGSAWCHQEIGWAMGRRIPHLAIRIGADPKGFLGRVQWDSLPDGDPKKVASAISAWVAGLPALGPRVVDGLIQALAESTNYFDAEAAAKRIEALGTLTNEQFAQVDEAWWNNDQLHGGYLPQQVMRRFYENNQRPWPPPKLADSNDEHPF